MKEIILLKDGELALKGLNRSTFEDILIKNIRMRISSLGNFKYRKSQSTIVIEPENEDIDLDEAVSRICKVFGLVGISRAAVSENFAKGRDKRVDTLVNLWYNITWLLIYQQF